MRKIVILQSIIIILGALYIYATRATVNTPVENESLDAEEVQIESISDATSTNESESSNDEVEVEMENEAEITGPNDAGMEFPILEEGF